MNKYYITEDGHYLSNEDIIGLIKWLVDQGEEREEIFNYDESLAWKDSVSNFFKE